MIDWSVALASLKAAQSAADKYTDLPLKQALITAYDGILHTKEQALSIQEDLHEARRRIMELEQHLAKRNTDPKEGLTFDRGVWWAGESREVSPDGPFCTKCLEAQVGRRTLQRHGQNEWGTCLHCDSKYKVWPDDRPPHNPYPNARGNRPKGWL